MRDKHLCPGERFDTDRKFDTNHWLSVSKFPAQYQTTTIDTRFQSGNTLIAIDGTNVERWSPLDHFVCWFSRFDGGSPEHYNNIPLEEGINSSSTGGLPSGRMYLCTMWMQIGERIITFAYLSSQIYGPVLQGKWFVQTLDCPFVWNGAMSKHEDWIFMVLCTFIE